MPPIRKRLDPLIELRLQRGVEHLHRRGMPAIVALLTEYERRPMPTMIRAVGADRFPVRALHVVPQ